MRSIFRSAALCALLALAACATAPQKQSTFDYDVPGAVAGQKKPVFGTSGAPTQITLDDPSHLNSSDQLNIGTTPNDGTGDTLRQGGVKIKQDFADQNAMNAQLYQWATSALDAAVDASVANVTPLGATTARALNAVASDQSNVLAFGADPLRIADSAAAFNAAATNATRAGSVIGSVHVPAGSYYLKSAVNIGGQCLYGDGEAASVLYVDAAFSPSALGIITTSGDTSPFDLGPCIYGLSIVGAQPGQVTTTANGAQSSGSTTLVLASATHVVSGDYVVDATNPAAIPPLTTCALSGLTCTLSNPVTATTITSGDSIQINIPRSAYVALGTCTGVAGGTGCQYPPAIYSATSGTRLHVHDVHMGSMWDCVSTLGNVVVTFDDIECGALNIGWQTDGASDFQHIHNWHNWAWGFAGGQVGGANVGNAYGDGQTIAFQIGNSSLDAGDLDFFASKFVMASDALKTPITIAGLKLDSEGAYIEMNEASGSSTNGPVHISGGYRTGQSFAQVSGSASAGGAGSLTDSTQSWTSNQWAGYTLHDSTAGFWASISANTATGLTLSNGTAAGSDAYTIAKCPINVTGGFLELDNFNENGPGGSASPAACVSGGTLKMTGGTAYNGTAAFPAFMQTGGTLDIEDVEGRFPATALTVPMFLAYGGITILLDDTNINASTGTIVSVATDSAQNFIAGNNFGAATYSFPGSTGTYGATCTSGVSASTGTSKNGVITHC